VGKPKIAGPDEISMQTKLELSEKYKAVVDGASEVGFHVVPGQMRICKIPITSRVFWIFPIIRGCDPHTFLIQPMTDRDQSAIKTLIVANKNNDVLGAAILDPDIISNGIGTAGTPAYKRAFLECAKEHLSDCAIPCGKKMIECAPAFVFALTASGGNAAHATALYVVAVLGSQECGGCGIQAFVDTIIDYGMATVPSLKKKNELIERNDFEGVDH